MKWIQCFLLTFLAAVHVDAHFRCDYKYVKSAEGYFKYQEIPTTWESASLRCHYEGAVLASPLNPEMMTYMKNITNHSSFGQGVFTGIHSKFSRGDHASIEGVPLSKIPHTWAQGQPNNKEGIELCIVMLRDGTMADRQCSSILPYFCFKKATKPLIMNSCGTTDHEYALDSRTGKCYKFHVIGHTWSNAQMICTDEGGHLAIINSDIEAKVLQDIFAKHPAASITNGEIMKDSILVGFSYWHSHRTFMTVEGKTLKETGYDKFQEGEPNNRHGIQYCGGMFRHNGRLGDIQCDFPIVFICEKSPHSLMDDCEDEMLTVRF